MYKAFHSMKKDPFIYSIPRGSIYRYDIIPVPSEEGTPKSGDGKEDG